MSDRFMIIDGNALVHRAFHALPPLSTKDGKMVNAVYGFTTVLMKALKELKPAYAAVTFDLPGPTFRDELYAEYKAQRVKQPQELYDQLPLVKEVVRAFGIPVVEKEGVEADDVIATLSRKLVNSQTRDLETIIVTGDMDTLQLVDEHTKVYSFRKGFSDTVIYDEAAVRQRFGLKPEQMVDYKALRGDPSDNIPGVRGIGEKTAATLLQKFGSLETIYKNLDKISGRAGELLREHKDDALLGKKLVELRRDVPIGVALEDCKVSVPDAQKLREVFEKFGFKNLIARLEEGGRKEQGMLLSRNPSPPPQSSPLKGEEQRRNSPPLVGGARGGDQLIKQIQVAAYLLNIGDRERTIESITKEYGIEYVASDFMSDTSGRQAAALLKHLEADLKQKNLLTLYEDIEKPLIPVLEQMSRLGIKVNIAYLKDLSTQFGKELTALEKKIHHLAGGEFNINSPVQLREILFEKLGLAPPAGRIKKTAKGGVASTAAGELEKLRGAHPIVDLLFDYRELAKLKSTYTDALVELVGKDGRIHTTFNQTVTATGRLSSSDPNLQNIPIRTERGRQIRKSFIAEPGFVLLSADYSQIELRVAASLSGDPEMIKSFQSGHDFHTETAVRVFGVTPDKVTPEMRRNAKAINFGIIYGMGATSLAQSTGLSRSEAEQFIARYFEVFSTLHAFLEGLKQHARDKGYVATLFGRRRYLPEITSGVQQVRAAAERMAINMPVQGCLPAEAKILTSRGYIPIGDLYKMNSHERPKYVWDGSQWRRYRVLDRGKAELAAIILRNGYILRCDTRHSVLVAGDSEYVWKSFHGLKEGDKVCCSFPREHSFETLPDITFRYTPNVHNSPSVKIEKLDREFWYWLGYYYGDGWITIRKIKNRQGKLYDKTVLEYAFGHKEQEQMLRCREYFMKLGFAPRIRTFASTAPQRHNKFALSIESRGLGHLLQTIGVNAGERSHTKRFLSRIFSESLEIRTTFLRGFLDADGWYGRNSRDVVGIHLCQRGLLEDTYLLLKTTGIPSKIRGPYRRGAQTSYRLDIPRSYVEEIIAGNPRTSAPKLGITTPRFLIEALLKQYPHLPKSFFLNPSDHVIYHRWRQGGSCSLYYLDYFVRKYNLDIGLPIYDLSEVGKKETRGIFETTYTLSVEGSHRFDSEGVISKNTAADLMKMAMVAIYNSMTAEQQDNKVRMLLQVHDELVFEIKKDLVSEVAPKIKSIMESVHELKVSLKVEFKQGKNWGDLHSF